MSMGGTFDANLTMSTTHLVAARFDTEKYTVASTMKVSTICLSAIDLKTGTGFHFLTPNQPKVWGR